MNPITKTAIINVSNRLPVTITGNEIKTSSGGLVAALEGLPRDQYDLLWLGWPGSEIPEPERQRDLRQRLRDEIGCIPVFLTREEADGHYAIDAARARHAREFPALS